MFLISYVSNPVTARTFSFEEMEHETKILTLKKRIMEPFPSPHLRYGDKDWKLVEILLKMHGFVLLELHDHSIGETIEA